MPGKYKPLPGAGKGNKGKKAVAQRPVTKPRPGGPPPVKPLPIKKKAR